MFTSVELSNLRFAAPVFLPLLAVPALLAVVWAWQAWRRGRTTCAPMRR